MEHAELRLAEVKAELEKEDVEAANRALEQYREKIESAVSGEDRDDIGLINAQESIVKHQLVLQLLNGSHPNNTGLLRSLKNWNLKLKPEGASLRLRLNSGSR